MKPNNLMKHNIVFWSISLFTVAFSACRRPPTKNVPLADSTAVVAPAIIDTVAAVIKPTEPEVVADELNFNYLTAKSKVSFKSKDQSIENASVNTRMKKDSVIWLSIATMGIEVARGLITTDSVFFVDRYHKEYFKNDFSTLSKNFNFNLNFDLIQSILVGNMPFPQKPNERFKKENDYFLLKQEEGKVVLENYIGQHNRRLKKLLVTEQPTKKTLTLNYEDFTELNNFVFPYTSLIQLDYQSEKDEQQYKTVFKIKHQKIELPEQALTFPFSIPSNYKKKEN